MKKNLRYLISIVVLGSLFAGFASAQVAPPPSPVKKVGSNILPLSTSTTLGSSSVNGAFNNVTVSGTCSGCGSGSGVSTSSANTFTANQQFSGGATDASSTHIVPTYTYSVCQNPGECDFTTLQAALAQASSTQQPTAIYERAGTYVEPATGYQVCSPSLIIFGDGLGTINQFSNATGSALSMCDGTQRSNFIVANMKFQYTGSGTTTIGLDYDHFALGTFMNLKVTNFNDSFYASSTGSLYNKFFDNVDSPLNSANYGYYVGKNVNETLIFGARTIASASTTCIGVYGQGTININLTEDDCETGAQVALDIGNGVHGVSANSFYSEANAIGAQIASNTYAISFTGGNFDLATTTAGQPGPEEINNLGGIYCFYNVVVNFKNFSHCETQANAPEQRWVQPYASNNVGGGTSQTFASTTIELSEVEFTKDTFINSFSFIPGTASNTVGTVMAGLYGPLTTEESCANTTLLVQATSSAPTSTAVNDFEIPLASSFLVPAGRYCEALAADNSTSTYLRNSNGNIVTGWTETVPKLGASTTLPLTIAAASTTNTGSSIPNMRVRAVSQTNTL